MRRLFNILFKLLYHQFAFSYDLIAWMVSLGNWRAWAREILPFISQGRVLELGFGPGHLQIDLYGRGRVPYGLDESKQMSRLAKQRLIRIGLPVRLTRGLAESIPFAAESFDAVIATFPAPYIFKAASAREIARVLKNDGEMAVLLGAQPGGPLRLLFKIAGLAPESAFDFNSIVSLYAQAGLNLEFQWQKVPTGQILIMKAIKISG